MWNAFLVFLLLLISALPSHARAEENLFSRVEIGPAPEPKDAYRGTWTVDLNLPELQNPARTITLNLPDGTKSSVQLLHWEARSGYTQLFDEDGYEIEKPDPNASPADFSWFWYGKSDSWTVSITLHKGIAAGRISSASQRFAIEPRPNKVTQLGLVNSAYWKTHPDDSDSPEESNKLPHEDTKTGHVASPLLTPAAQLKGGWDSSCSSPLDVSVNSVVDVLFLYTPGFQSAVGGTTQVEASVQASIDDSNISLRNTGIYSVTYQAAGIEAVPVSSGFNYDTSLIRDGLRRLSGRTDSTTYPWCDFSSPNTAVQARRAATKADVVALVRRDSTTPAERSCGVSWVQRVVTNNSCIMEPGHDWGDKFPYLVFDGQCGADRLNLAHELGHILGMEHDPRNSAAGTSGFDPSCPWSFGNRRSGSGVLGAYKFRSIMAYPYNATSSGYLPGPAACALVTSPNDYDCPVIDAYSNWNLQWAGPSGIQPLPLLPNSATIGVQSPVLSGQPQAHAFDTLQRLGQVVGEFVMRSDGIFADGFE